MRGLTSAILAVLWLAPGLASCGGEHDTALPFDAEAWKTASTTSDDARQRMYGDLVKHAEFVGKTKPEILALLGPPTQEFPRDDAVIWEYRLGPERGRPSIDSEWLQLTFRGMPMAVERFALVTD